MWQDGGKKTLAIVIVENDDLEAALKLLDKKVEKEQIMKELKNRRFYKSKGYKQREAKKLAIKRIKRRIKKKANCNNDY